MPDRHRTATAVAALALTAAAVALPTAAAEPTADYPTDGRGYVGTAAHCDSSQTLVEMGRTTRALVAICIDADAELEYRGVRLSDKAGLTMPATRRADGTVTAVNDGVTYAVTPQQILVSEGDTVIYRDAWTEFREPSFSGERPRQVSPTPSAGPTTSASPSTTASPTTSASPSTASPTASPAPSKPANSSPTVSTTTVTLAPRSS